MKKVFNLSVILAVLMAAFTFTSCGDDDDDAAQITINFNSNGVFLCGDDVTGNIQSYEEELTKVTILENRSAIKTYTSFKSLPIMGQSGLYSIIIFGLSYGSYTMRAESKTVDTSANFTIGDEYDSFE